MSYGEQMKARRDDTLLTIGDLYPDLSEEGRGDAEDNLDRYVPVVLRIYERIRQDPEAYAEFRALTDSERYARMKESGSTSA